MKSTKVTIQQNQNNDEVYTLKLKKRRFPWWILLFLLPLLLLIKCKKDVTFKVQNQTSKEVVANAKTTFSYNRRVLFSNELINFSDTTNSEGIVTFKDTEYSLYTLIFYRNDTCNFAVLSDCYSANSTVYKYHKLKHKKVEIVELDYIKKDFTFTVIQQPENLIMPDVEVNIKIENENNTIEAIDTTDINGNVVFKNLPLCSKIEITAKKYGYYDSTYNFLSDSIYSNITQIYLRPITKSISFWVKNLNTKQPIPNAQAELIIDEIYSGYKITTNTSGIFSVAENGLFENVHIIKSMKIFATKTDFYDTIYPQTAKKVEEFITADAETRTVYLRPKAKCIDIKIVDADSKNSIDGAECIITINGKETKTEYSNILGVVQICGLTNDDIISITASKMGYDLNNYTVKDLKIETYTGETEIPLKKEAPPSELIKVKLKIFDYNSAQDDYYDVYFDGKKIGVLENTIGGTSEYEIEAETGTTIKVDLILTKDMGNSTGATIYTEPGSYSEDFSGNTDHTFYIPISK